MSHQQEQQPVSQELQPLVPRKTKVVFVPNAVRAQRVEEEPSPLELTPSGQTGQSAEYLVSKETTMIPHEYKNRGRPVKEGKPTLRLPPGYQTLRVIGKVVYNDEVGSQFLEAYYETGGSMTRACKKVGVRFRAALEWKDTIPEFAMGLREVDEIIRDEIHSQFMARVLEEWEPNPSWKFKYFNKYFPEYSETRKSLKVSVQLKDTLIKPEIVEGEVVRKQLGPSDETGPERPLETPTNPS